MYNKIMQEIKEAMKTKNTNKKDVLKMVVDKAKAIVKETNPHDNTNNISDQVIIQAINKELKQLNQTKDSLEGRGCSDLYLITLEKIDILSAYLPQMMSKEEVVSKVSAILSTGDYPNMGAKMKAAMAALSGLADNKDIAAAVRGYKDV